MHLDPHQQISYAGDGLYTLDEKNRITIPASWRHGKKGEGEEFVISPGIDDTYLRVMVPAEFANMNAEVKANASVPPRDRTVYLRHLHSSAKHAFSDKQGRLVLPEDLCRLAGLKGEVHLVGNLGWFEVWNTHQRKQAAPAEKSIILRVADMVGH
jgi:transcriptional regulator MraZ